jgi:hypothetical protein
MKNSKLHDEFIENDYQLLYSAWRRSNFLINGK